MDELIRDTEEKLSKADSLKYIMDGGGIIKLPNLEQFPDQNKTPMLVIIDSGVAVIRHLSSNTIWRELNLKVHAIQRIFKRGDPLLGTPFARGIEEIVKDVFKVLDGDRFNGKYVQAQLTAEEDPGPVDDTKNMHLQEKALTFRYVRIESR